MLKPIPGSTVAVQLAMIEVLLNDPEGRTKRDSHRIAVSRLLRSIADVCERKEDRSHIAMIRKDCDIFFSEVSLNEDRTDCRSLVAFHLRALRKSFLQQSAQFASILAA